MNEVLLVHFLNFAMLCFTPERITFLSVPPCRTVFFRQVLSVEGKARAKDVLDFVSCSVQSSCGEDDPQPVWSSFFY